MCCKTFYNTFFIFYSHLGLHLKGFAHLIIHFFEFVEHYELKLF